MESRTRSSTCWPERNAPDSQRRASTNVVFPWSTWATIAMLRMSWRVATSATIDSQALSFADSPSARTPRTVPTTHRGPFLLDTRGKNASAVRRSIQYGRPPLGIGLAGGVSEDAQERACPSDLFEAAPQVRRSRG